jgi:hypothetical protein
MPIQAFKTNTVKNKCVIINAKNFINDMALRDSVFPFGHKGLKICMQGHWVGGHIETYQFYIHHFRSFVYDFTAINNRTTQLIYLDVYT